MVSKRCKSGKHWWDSSETEELEKCCNGWACVDVPCTNYQPDEDKLNPYDENGWATYCRILVHESEVERIKRLRAREPDAIQTNTNGNLLIN